MSWVNSLDWDQLQPIWVSGRDSTTINEFVFVCGNGSKLTSNNGNNGHSMNAYVKGVARGAFKIQFKLGYAWGYSYFYAANIDLVNNNAPNSGNYHASGSAYSGIRFRNNSSNNHIVVNKSISGTSTEISNTQPGLNDVIITLWRDESNVVKYKMGTAATVTVGTITDTWVFATTQQSPASCELIMAMGLAQAPS